LVAALPSFVYASARGVNVKLLISAVAVVVGVAEAVGVSEGSTRYCRRVVGVGGPSVGVKLLVELVAMVAGVWL
jgi:hypothetical protein